MKLTSCVSCKELVSRRELHVAHERVLELADDGSRLVVAYGRTEADSSVLKSDCERKIHLQRMSAVNEVLVCDSDYIAVL